MKTLLMAYRKHSTVILVVVIGLALSAGLFALWLGGGYFQTQLVPGTTSTTVEPENGTVSAPAVVGTDTTAFGGKYIQFGPTSTSVAPELVSMLQNVSTATAFRFGVKDNLGNGMDTLKIIENPQGGYLGVYHRLVSGVFYAKLATSSDLLNWTFKVDLDAHSHQPTIAKLSDGSFVVAYEMDSGGTVQCLGSGGSGNNCIRIRHYPNTAALYAASPDRSFDVARTLSNCAEGTPNIYSAKLNPDIDHSTLDIGFHYFRNCDVDRQARGTLTNFNSWNAQVESGINTLFEALTNPVIGGNVGDRDDMFHKTQQFNIYEAQGTKGDFCTWRTYLYDYAGNALTKLIPVTPGGRVSFANPSFTNITSPGGRPAVVATYFLPSDNGILPTPGACPGTDAAGELLMYKEY